MGKNTDEKSKIDVTCPKCQKVRRVSRYSVAGSWQTDHSPDSVEFSVDARTCHTCRLREGAKELRANLTKVESQIAKREADGL